MICLGDVEKLAFTPMRLLGVARIISLGISCIAHGVCGKAFTGISALLTFLLFWSFSFSFSSFSIYIISVPLDYSHCVRDWSCYTSCICLGQRFWSFPINVWSILYRYCLCMKATKLRLNSIQWHNIYS